MSEELFGGNDPTPPTEPYKTFKINLAALLTFVGEVSDQLVQHRQDSRVFLQEVEKARMVAADSKANLLKLADDFQEKLENFRQIEHVFAKTEKLAEYREQLKQMEELSNTIMNDIGDIESSTKDWVSKCKIADLSFSIIDSQRSFLLPMAFVYLVTLWDAFIADTAARILEVHPQLISESSANIQLGKSDIWKLDNIQDVKTLLIDAEIRQLNDRKKLVDIFRDYWGIDFNKAMLNLDDVAEIRARRDIWVHNAGVVNEQYRGMATKGNSLDKGQVAEITYEYFEKSLTTLLLFATFIHDEASAKHYSKDGQN